MTDKPLDCIGLPLTAQIGKHDFRHTAATSTSAPSAKLDESWLQQAVAAMKGLPPVEATIHHANVGSKFWERMTAGADDAPPAREPHSGLYGFPVYADDALPPDVCEFRNKDGKVLSTLRLEP